MVALELDLPRAIEAEQAVIGAVVQSARAYADFSRTLTAEMFFQPRHATIWTVVADLVEGRQPVNPTSVMQELLRAKELERIGGATYLSDLVASPWNSHESVDIVAEKAQQRRAVQLVQRLAQNLEEHAGDHEELFSALARESLSLNMLVDERVGIAPIENLNTWDVFLDKHKGGIRWMIPNLLMKQDVWMILAGEGGGKSFFTRQICFALGAGIHPWHPDRQVAPRRTLHIDLENAAEIVAEESSPIRQVVKGIGGYEPEAVHIWHRPRGLDIRDRKDAMLLERAIAETEAEVVTIGSLYKLFNRRGDSWDQAAEEARVVLDRLRERYDIALIIEAHQPKGSGGSDRPNTPFGSQQWIGWAAVGRTIRRVGDNMWMLDQFRGDRGKRDMPIALTRGGTLPWTPIWDEMEAKNGMWDELLSKDEKKDLGR